MGDRRSEEACRVSGRPQQLLRSGARTAARTATGGGLRLGARFAVDQTLASGRKTTSIKEPASSSSIVAREPSSWLRPPVSNGSRSRARAGSTRDGDQKRCLLGRTSLQTPFSAFHREKTSGHSAGAAGCGDYRLQPALCGDSRAGCARDDEEAGGRSRPTGQRSMRICRAFIEELRERRDSNPRPPA